MVLQVADQHENVLSNPVPPEIWLKITLSCISIAYSHHDAWEFVATVHNSASTVRMYSVKFKTSNLSAGTWWLVSNSLTAGIVFLQLSKR